MKASAAHLPARPERPKVPLAVTDATPLPSSDPVELWIDGACSPNPGPMGIGYVINTLRSKEHQDRTRVPIMDGCLSCGRTDTERTYGRCKGECQPHPTTQPRVLVRVGAQVGQGTNNLAEYLALIAGLRHALRLGYWNVRVFSDSQLLVNQVNGRFRVRDKALKQQWGEVQRLVGLFEDFRLDHVRREQNAEADALSHELVFEEPPLPALAERVGNNPIPKLLHDWQAAFCRVHTMRGAGAGLLARVFGVHRGTVEQVQYGHSYRKADFSRYAIRFEDRITQEMHDAAQALLPTPACDCKTSDTCQTCDPIGYAEFGGSGGLPPGVELEILEPEDSAESDGLPPAPVCVVRRCVSCGHLPQEGASKLCIMCQAKQDAHTNDDFLDWADSVSVQ